MAKTAYPTQSTSHIGRIRHRRNGAKPAKWATNAATKSPTVANTVERGIAPGRMRGERGAQDRTAGGTHRLPHAYSARVQRSERGRAAAGEGRRTAGQRGDLSALPHVGLRPYSRQRHRIQMLPADPRPARAGRGSAGLADGTLDGVVTDHSPASADMKAGTLATAWGGVSSLQVGFRAVLTGAMRRGLSLADVVRWMSCNTARLVGLDDRGDITPVLRADLAIIRPYERFVVDATALESRNPICACDGMTLNGVVTRTFVAGRDALSGVREGNLIVRP